MHIQSSSLCKQVISANTIINIYVNTCKWLHVNRITIVHHCGAKTAGAQEPLGDCFKVPDRMIVTQYSYFPRGTALKAALQRNIAHWSRAHVALHVTDTNL